MGFKTNYHSVEPIKSYEQFKKFLAGNAKKLLNWTTLKEGFSRQPLGQKI
jgi:hypothetical protein